MNIKTQTLNAWLAGDKEAAFDIFCRDPDSIKISFEQFCKNYDDKYVKRHFEVIAMHKNHLSELV